MNGHILKNFPICVDYFKVKYNSGNYLYFLTHVHADHIVGLTKHFEHRVYCSEVTARLIRHKLNITTVQNNFIEIPELQPYVICHNGICITVTVIPANHCPGSSMFLFESKSLRIFYTGDFRYNNFISEIGKTYWGKSKPKIDYLYLDNSYCEPNCNFPSREAATEEIINICLKYSDCRIYIGISWIGHENLLISLAKSLRENIVVTHEHYKVLELLKLDNVFTTKKSAGRIYAIPHGQLNTKFLKNVCHLDSNTIGIKPTGRFYGIGNNKQFNEGMYVIPYSNHCSYKEIVQMVKEIRPCKIYPIVSGNQNICSKNIGTMFRADMSRFNTMLNNDKVTKNATTNSAKKKMLSLYNNVDSNENNASRKFNKNHCKRRKKSFKPQGVIFDD